MIEIFSLAIEKNKSVFIKRHVSETGKSLAINPPQVSQGKRSNSLGWVGGALLLTPGFVTDAIGFALLIPQARQWLLLKLVDRYRDKIIIEGEFRRVDDRNF